MVIIVIVAGLMGWNMINVIRQNYEYQQRADKIVDDISLMELENEKLKYNIEYYKTDSYLEQRARESLNLRAPGERVIVVPKRKTAAEKQPQEDHQQESNNISKTFRIGKTYFLGGLGLALDSLVDWEG